MDLLPRDFGEFRSQGYWDKFFQVRKGRPFEWYGEWADLKPLLTLPQCVGRCDPLHVSHKNLAQHGPTDGANRTNGDSSDVAEVPVQGSGEIGGTYATGVTAGLESLHVSGANNSIPSFTTNIPSSEGNNRGGMRILVPGCGNSELSACLYDYLNGEVHWSDNQGPVTGQRSGGDVELKEVSGKKKGGKARNKAWQVNEQSRNDQSSPTAASQPTANGVKSSSQQGEASHSIMNIDFSQVVIGEMKKKHEKARPGMDWLVMDMTRTSFSEGSFDAVLDKGCLDALMGEEGEDAEVSGQNFLEEVARLVNPTGGRYLCVTLGQEHVMELLLRSFRSPNWTTGVFKVPLQALNQSGSTPAPKSQPSLEPFLVVVTHQAHASSAKSNAQEEQETAVHLVEILFTDQDTRHSDQEQIEGLLGAIARENKVRAAMSSPPPQRADVAVAAGGKQGFSEEDLKALQHLSPGRRMTRQLGAASADAKGERFSATVLDVPGTRLPERGSIPCAVFLVPQGREHEWLFASEDGQWELATSAKAQRLILISLSRLHTFGTSKEVQAELSPLVLPLATESCHSKAFSIPYMTTQEGIGWRQAVAEVESPLSGTIIVEDVEAPEDSLEGSDSRPALPKGTHLRRLVFARNLGLIQSEAVLKGPDVKMPGADVRTPGADVRTPGADVRKAVDLEQLANAYHAAMLAGMALIGSHVLDRIRGEQTGMRAIVVGLGGGALPMFLHQHFPFASITVAELDPVVHFLARTHFGYQEDAVLKTHVGDGVALVEDIARQKAAASGASFGVDLIFVDADSDDASSGMSCPAPVFVGEGFLLSAKQALSEEGVLVINVVARSKHRFEEACQLILQVFPSLFELDVDGDVNRVLFALPKPLASPDAKVLKLTAIKIVAAASKQRPWGKGPSLLKLLANLKQVQKEGK